MNIYSDNPGKALKSLRIASGCSIVEFAQNLKIHQDDLVRWENGINFPTYHVIKRIEDLYKTLVLHKDEDIEVYSMLIAGKELSITEFTKALKMMDTAEIESRLQDYSINDFTPGNMTALLVFYQGDLIDTWFDDNLKNYSVSQLSGTFPFLNERRLDKIVDNVGAVNKIHAILPFLSKDKCDAIALRYYQETQSTKSLASIAPFVSQKMLNKILKEALNKGDH